MHPQGGGMRIPSVMECESPGWWNTNPQGGGMRIPRGCYANPQGGGMLTLRNKVIFYPDILKDFLLGIGGFVCAL